MGKVISIVNQKGGVGKTTTAVNLCAYLAKLSKKILIIDIDSQANASSGLGIDHKNLNFSIYDALIGKKDIWQITKKTLQTNLSIAPANPHLAGAAIELTKIENREYILANLLEKIKNEYDYIIIDGPPSLGLLTINSLIASDEILIPVQSEYYALEGLGQLLETINLVQANLKPDLSILGVVVTMFDRRNRLSKLVLKELYKYFPKRVFRSVIPRSVRLAEAPSYGRPILHYDPRSKGGKAYEKLAREILSL